MIDNQKPTPTPEAAAAASPDAVLVMNLQYALISHGHDADCPVVHGASVDCVPGTCERLRPSPGEAPADLREAAPPQPQAQPSEAAPILEACTLVKVLALEGNRTHLTLNMDNATWQKLRAYLVSPVPTPTAGAPTSFRPTHGGKACWNCDYKQYQHEGPDLRCPNPGAGAPTQAADDAHVTELDGGFFVMTESGRRLMSLSRGSRAIDKEPGVTAAEMEACAWALAYKLLQVDERAGGAGSQAPGARPMKLRAEVLLGPILHISAPEEPHTEPATITIAKRIGTEIAYRINAFEGGAAEGPAGGAV